MQLFTISKILKLCLPFTFFTLISVPSQDSNFDINKAFDSKNVIPLAIIGSGPAGLTAAMYGNRLGYPTTVFAGPLIGGQLTETTYIDNWPGIEKIEGSALMQTLQKQAEKTGAVILEDTIVAVDFSVWPFILTTESKLKLNALAVIIATGAAPRRLGIPGELEYWGKGVTACSVCDCIFFKGKEVVVVGGGDSAVEEATHLSHYASKITVLVRKGRMRATPIMRDRLEDYKNIHVMYNKQIVKVLGNGKTVTGLELIDTETNKTEQLKTDGLFLAIGRNPNSDLFKSNLKLTKNGYIHIEGRSQATSVTGVYAAGDVEDSEIRQAIYAGGNGAKAAYEATAWLKQIGLTDLAIKRHITMFDSKSYKEQKDEVQTSSL